MSVSLSSSNHPSSYPILQEWAAKRKIQKHEGIGFSGHLIRVIGTIVALILAIPVIALVGLYNIGVSLRERYIIRYYPDHILSVIRQMKQKEEIDKFNTIVEVLKVDQGPLENLSPSVIAKNLTQDVQTKLEDPAVVQNRGIRIILRMLAAQRPLEPNWLKALQDPEIVQLLNFNDRTVPYQFLQKLNEKYRDLSFNLCWEEVIKKVNKANIPSKQIESETAKFEKSLTSLVNILKQKPGTNAGQLNTQFITAFRNVLNTPAYAALKEDGSQPAIQLLHHFASAMWNKAPSVDAYAKVGEAIAKTMDSQEKTHSVELQAITVGSAGIAEKLTKSHNQMEKDHYSAHGISGVLYALTHPLQIMGALASEGGPARHIPRIFGLDVYDSHGTLANNPSLQGVTDIKLTFDETLYHAKVSNCYGGSPTIGDHQIAPEFEALLVAAENNQMAPKDKQDLSIPMIVNYNNLQNLDKSHGESPRSRTIMLMNQKYPLSFMGTTFAKDSNLYLMPKDKDVVWTNAKEFGDILLKQLLRSFDSKDQGHGFYFHGSIEDWKGQFIKIIENCNHHFENLDPTLLENMTPRDLQGAYQEYVYSMLNATLEMCSVCMIAERGEMEGNFNVMALSACKENIDRGGMENTKYMYTKLEEIQEYLLLGVMHSRALSARDRVILGARMPQILNFMRVTEPTIFQKNQKELFKQLGLEIESNYVPHRTV